jgi:hypothetical protein
VEKPNIQRLKFLGHCSAGNPTPENGLNQAIIPILIFMQRTLSQQLF